MIVYKFYSDTCAPCKLVEKQLTDSNIKHISLNIDDQIQNVYANKFNVRSVPTTIVVDDNNKILFKQIGVFNKSNLDKLINLVK